MNTKFVRLLISLVAFLVIGGISVAHATSSGSGYNAPIVMDEFHFTATYSNGEVHMGWNAYVPSNFNYYKVIRSTTEQNPVYPDDGYIKYSSDADFTSYVDHDVPAGTVYYRVCSIASPNRYCSRVVIIHSTGETIYSEPDEVKTIDAEPAEITLSGKLIEGYIKLNWNVVNGTTPDGFKIAISTFNNNPTYPVMSGDSYRYLTDSSTRSYSDKYIKAGKTYYYRVCKYNGHGECINYSNNIEISVPSDYLSAESVKDGVYTGIEPAVIKLTGSVEKGYLNLNWTVSGTAPKGFKVAKSKVNQNPTYPVIKGDTYKYLSSPDVRQNRDFNIMGGNTYHYRVCQYNGNGECISYSNALALKVPSDFTSAKEGYTEKVITASGTVDDYKYHTYSNSIDYLMNKKIVQGYDDGTFRPDNTINRAEFMKIVVGAKYSSDYINVSKRNNCFSDVRAAWYAPYVCIAKDEAMVGGYPDGTFKPEKNISFVEAAKILSEAYGLNATKGSNWYTGYVKALQENNYIPSTVTNLEKPITRAEMSELIWRIKEEKRDQFSSKLIEGDVTMESGEYSGWKQYSKDGFSFYHPNWYQGEKWGHDILTEELDFYQNLNTPNYMAVDTYMNVYTVAGSNLHTSVWFDHPLISSQELTINGVKALKRHFRAPRSTVVNGRTTGENENITIYTYQLPGKVVVLHYFNAHGTENKDVETFYKIASSFQIQ